jgi:hypothetical protein
LHSNRVTINGKAITDKNRSIFGPKAITDKNRCAASLSALRIKTTGNPEKP